MKRTIRFQKHNGEIKNKGIIYQHLEQMFKIIPNGEHELISRKVVKPRSLDQNALMWLWFACLEKETGTDKQDVHDYYCQLFLSRKAMINREEKTIFGGTSKLNTVQFTDFLNKVQADAGIEFGIALPNPDDLYWSEFEDYYKNYV